MPALSEKHIQLLGPPVLPFERSDTKTFDLDDLKSRGEAHNDEFQYAIYNGIDDGRPTTPYLEVTIEEKESERILKGRKFKRKCYLWVIDETSIKIILEKTPNILRGSSISNKNYVCHSNITGCNPALAGGEMYFCEDGNIYMNFASDRYGYRGRDERKQNLISVMEHMLYKNIVLLKDFF